MIGFKSRTTSPSRSTRRRNTPCVAGWCGPMLTVITSVSRGAVSGGPAGGRTASVLGPPETAPGAPVDALTSASAIVALVVCERDGLAADREVPALRPAHVVVGQQDAPQIGMAPEDDPEEVEGFALLELSRRKKLYAGV